MMRIFICGVVLLGFDAVSACAAEKAVEAKNGMVVSVSAPGSDAGLDILRNGGNAVDAAVATAFALSVTYPAAGNIGGGGFMLIHPPTGSPVVIDYRETAPASATPEMFIDQKTAYAHNVVGVPGTVRGLALAHRKFGKLPWNELMQPAIRLATDGFVLEYWSAHSLNQLLAGSKDFVELQRVFGKPNGDKWKAGDRLVQPDLAKTLSQIAEQGPNAFYTGKVAEQIVDEMRFGRGLITADDLARYRAKERKPIHGTYRGFDVYAPPPPSSGGICLVEMLNILETFDLKKNGRWSPPTVHLMAEAMRRAYRDRAAHLGDPDFTNIPDCLTAKGYARDLAQSIHVAKATPSESLAGDVRISPEGEDTTHFSVIDKDGLAVSNTYTLEHSYGSKIVVRGAGFLLNNEMTDFNWRPGVTDRTGRIGTSPNLVGPGKRMLSSQTPTIVARNGKVALITGSPGGRTIINTVLCVVVNVIDFGMDIQSAVDAPRQHHQWFPDEIKIESGAPETLISELRKLGHRISTARQGDAHSIWADMKTGRYHGAADRRIMGKTSGY